MKLKIKKIIDIKNKMICIKHHEFNLRYINIFIQLILNLFKNLCGKRKIKNKFNKGIGAKAPVDSIYPIHDLKVLAKSIYELVSIV